mgnify:CR=1 FL=1
MTDLELVLNSLAEITTTELCKTYNPLGMNETKEQAITGGRIAGNTRKEIETQLGHTVISSNNAKEKEKLIVNKKN